MRCQLLVRVTKFDNPCYYFLDSYNFNEAYARGYKDKNTFVFKTPYRSTGSPCAPTNVKFEQVDPGHIKVIYFDDPVLIAHGYTRYKVGHDDHIHVRFCEAAHPDPHYVCPSG